MTLRATDFYPYEYLLRIRPVECTNCKAQHSHSELMLVRVHTTMGAGSAARQLTPVDEITGDLPISTTLLPVRRVGVCHLCVANHPQADTLHKPQTSEARWAEALRADARVKRSDLMREARGAKQPVKPVGLQLPDDLSDIPE